MCLHIATACLLGEDIFPSGVLQQGSDNNTLSSGDAEQAGDDAFPSGVLGKSGGTVFCWSDADEGEEAHTPMDLGVDTALRLRHDTGLERIASMLWACTVLNETRVGRACMQALTDEDTTGAHTCTVFTVTVWHLCVYLCAQLCVYLWQYQCVQCGATIVVCRVVCNSVSKHACSATGVSSFIYNYIYIYVHPSTVSTLLYYSLRLFAHTFPQSCAICTISAEYRLRFRLCSTVEHVLFAFCSSSFYCDHGHAP